MRIRQGRAAELPLLQDIERAAGAPFRDLGMDAIADDEPPPLEDLEACRRAGRLWVAADPATDRPVAYLLAVPVDGYTHIEQISVHPDSARRPYYERIGFRRLADRELTPGLRKIRAREAELGLDLPHGASRMGGAPTPRVCMRRESRPR